MVHRYTSPPQPQSCVPPPVEIEMSMIHQVTPWSSNPILRTGPPPTTRRSPVTGSLVEALDHGVLHRLLLGLLTLKPLISDVVR